MPTTRRKHRAATVRPSGHTTFPSDTGFPRAVAGEDYLRYVRATRRQAERWFQREAHRIEPPALSMHEGRDILCAVIETELGRSPYEQEQRLLSELVHQRWQRLHPAETIEPEIPSFLVD